MFLTVDWIFIESSCGTVITGSALKMWENTSCVCVLDADLFCSFSTWKSSRSCLIHFTTSTTVPGGFWLHCRKPSCKSARSDTLLAFSERYSSTARTETDDLIRRLHPPSRGRHTGLDLIRERERERDEVCASFCTDGGGETLRKYLRISSWTLNNMKLLRARLCKKK